MILSSVGLFLVLALVNTLGLSIKGEEELAVPLDQNEVELELDVLEGMLSRGDGGRVKRDDRGITNYDIREALIQMLKAMRAQDKKEAQAAQAQDRKIDDIGEKVNGVGKSVEKKIDMISTYLIRMNNKIEALAKGGGGGSRRSTAILETLAQESYDIISLLPTYIDNTRKAIYFVGNDTKSMIDGLGNLLTDVDETGTRRNLREALDATETHILTASRELKDMVVESGSMAESLFERVDNGYKELENEIKGLANVEQVLLDTADSVMDTKRKIEFGVQQIIFKVTELVEVSGGEMDDNLAAKFEAITRTILSNQTQALTNLTMKVEKEIGQVWRQMGIMYGQLSNSIGILEKVKSTTEEYTNKSNKNLGSMDTQVEGLTDRMSEVDDNLNYMLSQLSLVVSEFNQVKTGLGQAMEGMEEDLLEEFKRQQGEDSQTPL